MAASILIVEDTPSLATVYQVQLARAGIASTIVGDGQSAIDAILSRPYDAMLLDLQLPDMDGLAVLQALSEQGANVTTIMITAHGSVQTATNAMRLGAYDFLMKPVSEDRLIDCIQNALKQKDILPEPERSLGSEQKNHMPDAPKSLEQVTKEASDRNPRAKGRNNKGQGKQKGQANLGFVGSSPAMQAIYGMIRSVAASQAAVFITGESGTGKEICAQAIHQAGPRKAGPFIALNCAAIPKDLIESELFGHRKGAFTGATADRLGAVFSANGGTLFLDEICEMDIALQSKLLRFLQTGQIQRVGDDRVQNVDIRVVCATNRTPIEEVAAGRFREDLYYRLHILALNLPPLRDRGHDAVELAEFFLLKAAEKEGKSFSSIDEEGRAWLSSQPWPGNVRQLENLVRSAVVMNEGSVLTAAMLQTMPLAASGGIPPSPAAPLVGQAGHASPAAMPETGPSIGHGSDYRVDLSRSYFQIEREILEAVIALHDGSLPKAAKSLDLSPSTLYRKRDAWQDSDLLSDG